MTCIFWTPRGCGGSISAPPRYQCNSILVIIISDIMTWHLPHFTEHRLTLSSLQKGEIREILMGVGDTVASVIMLTQFECARPPCWHSLSVPGAYAYIAHSVWVSPAPMLTQFVWSPAPHADTNLKLKQWNNLKYLLFQTKQLRWDMNSGNQLSRQPKYRQQLKFQSMKIVCLSE